MSKAKLYKVKLVQGFNAKGRRRAGIELAKNQTQILELTDEQLEALQEDVWIEVSEAPKDAEATAVGESYDDSGDAGEEDEVEVSTDMSREELESIAKEVGIEDPSQKNYSNKTKLVEAIKAASESEES